MRLLTKKPIASLAGAGLRTFFRIAEKWSLSNAQQMTLLGLGAPSTFFKWRKEQPDAVPRDTLERVSYILGIYQALHILLPDDAAADSWVHRPNTAPMFAGKPALERMLQGNVGDLYIVRQYLDAMRGGWA